MISLESYSQQKSNIVKLVIKDFHNKNWEIDIDIINFKVLTEDLPNVIKLCAITLATNYTRRIKC